MRTTRSSLPALETGLFRPGDRVLVAVSAGADSTALAHLLAHRSAELGVTLTLAHVDHGWRGADAARRDRARVERLAETLRIACSVSDPPPFEAPRTEAFARRYRYHMLHHIAVQLDCNVVTTAHHAGDQAETFLMRLLRGSGPIGLAGIPARRRLGAHCDGPPIHVVRPLLSADPAELRAYLRARHIDWVEDETNLDVRRDRARIRARLERHGGRHDLARLADRLRRRIEWREAGIETVARAQFEYQRTAQVVRMPRRFLATLDDIGIALALRHAGRSLGAGAEGPWLTRRHVEIARTMIEHGGAVDLPEGMHLHVGGSRHAWLARREMIDGPLPTLRVSHGTEADGVEVDADVLGDAPEVRLLRSSDTFVPPGRRSRVSVRRWLSKRGVPRWSRRGQLVVRGENGVAWIVGHGVDARHEPRGETTRIVWLSV